jgi:hypothetical protein
MVPGYTTSLKGVTLGGYAITEGPATVFEFRDEDEVGIFGPNSFPGKLVEMNLAKGELRIMAPDAPQRPEGPGHAYSDDERLPVVALNLPGASVEATLDTGNDSAFLLPLSLVSQIKLKGEPRKIGIATSAAGTQPVYEAQADGPVKVGGVVVEPRDFTDGELRTLTDLPAQRQRCAGLIGRPGRIVVVQALHIGGQRQRITQRDVAASDEAPGEMPSAATAVRRG